MDSSCRVSQWLAFAICVAAASLPVDADQAAERDATSNKNQAAASAELPETHYIAVPLPLTSSVELDVRRTIDERLSARDSADVRAILVLEFRPKEGGTGEGTDVAQAFSLARYLTSDKLNGVRTIAFLPRSIKGHAILAVLACEEIIMAADAELGEAGIEESSVDQTIRRLYTDVAERRRTIPPAIVLGMLDRQQAVYRVQTVDGVRYTLQDELDQLQKAGTVTAMDTVVRQGELGRFTGRELRLRFGFVSHLASDRAELATALKLPPNALEEDPSRGRGWKAIRIDITGPIHPKAINWIERSLEERIRSRSINFVCVVIESDGGSPVDSLRLAHFLAHLPPDQVRTVAFVSREARGDSALIALACDHLVVGEDAILGGPGNADIAERDRTQLRESVKTLANIKQRTWSLPAALIDPQLKVFRYTREGASSVSILCEDELATFENAASYSQGAPIETRNGISGQLAEELRLARFRAGSLEEFMQLYHLEDAFETIKPNWAHVLIEHLASPRFSAILLFAAFFAFYAEISTPGFGVAGFIGGLCLLLFFWAKVLHGTAGWLEILLFTAGVCCVLLELFVLPGFGIFGIGGALMMVTSIILASQTFVIPRNAYQLSTLPTSLFMVVAAGSGAIASIAVMRRVIPNTPVLNRMMLSPPDDEQLHDIQRREALVDYDDLLGQAGTAITPLVPGGKARFGDRFVDVMTEGDVIEKGEAVQVVQVRGNQVFVTRVA